MSARNSHDAKRNRRAARNAHHGVATNLALTGSDDPAEIEEAKQFTHDVVVRLLGDERRSAVAWAIFGPENSRRVVEEYLGASHADPDGRQLNEVPPWVAHVPDERGYLDWLDEHPDACVVVAVASHR